MTKLILNGKSKVPRYERIISDNEEIGSYLRTVGHDDMPTRIVIKPLDSGQIRMLAWELDTDVDGYRDKRKTHGVNFDDRAIYETGKDNTGKPYEYISWSGTWHPAYSKMDRFSLQSWDNWRTVYPHLSYLPKHPFPSSSWIVSACVPILWHIVLDDKSQQALAKFAEEVNERIG